MQPLENNSVPGEVRRGEDPGIQSFIANDFLGRPLFGHLPGMAYVGRPDRQRTMEMVGDGQRSLLGISTAGKPFLFAPHIHPDDRERVLDEVASAVSSQSTFGIEYRVHHACGDWHTVWEQGRPMEHGHQVWVLGYVMDIQPRLHLEHARRNASYQRLQLQKYNALNKLAAGISHELNNIVAGIMGSADLIGLDIPADHPCRDALKQLYECCQRAREFDHKIRALPHRPRLECRKVKPQSILEECLQILRTLISEKVEITVKIDPECPSIMADHMQLQQAVLDVCIQAWQGLAERRGQLQIELDVFYLDYASLEVTSLLQPGPHVRISVRDNGPGMTKSVKDRFFDPFHTRRSDGKKIGLEMFLVRETVQAHHGDISIDSEPGKGTACFIYLPIVAS